ncbi:hypothetical protein JDV02_002462 [Purpureocillium takamizusanense]|uniref:Uncharacterized protein n=1 Tax=Purpureocillium takamizusanense TaxID=2060973 RepID=A0A9Q8V8U7_9HYPO|nr:uncharacterized protein JDV02_002462 [Purpureocillium takamizusanense]UNI15981.1 hypothetical protein JDV02_002462 [Purpureocillium takamizusanense]
MDTPAVGPGASGTGQGDDRSGDVEPKIVQVHEEEAPTASHALADESLNDESVAQGASQVQHDDIEVRNLGWNDEAQRVPRPVVGGLTNEQLWTLIRRFDKQVFHVKSIDTPPLANLDMNIADEEEFSPDKLRANLERLYIIVVVPLVSFWKHIARLRSWKEYERTSTFLAVYVVAWLLDLIIPTLTAFVIVLVLYPSSREICFPPAPPALIDSKTGGVQKPKAGVLATDDTLTGAPEKHEGEAVEQEAHSLVNSIATQVAISTSAGKHPQGDPHDDSTAPDPSQITEGLSSAKEKSDGKEPSATHDKTKKPVSQAVWNKARPTMHLIADFVDTWERFGNALSPVPPFPKLRPRLVLAGCLVPLLLGSYFTTSYMLLKGTGFIFGFTFFGDPILTPLLDFANRTYPRWQKYVELRNSILKGVPTNAQLAVTLLRIGERNKAPVPPPPSSDMPPPVETDQDALENLDHLGATDEEIEEAAQPSHDAAHDDEEDKHETKQKPKKSRRILNLLKGTTKGGVETVLTADRAKAAAGEKHARDRLGVVKQPRSQGVAGPVSFPARYKGRKGHAYVTATATAPTLSWTSDLKDVNPAWTIAIADVQELKKMGGLGWKSKIIVGWALEKEVVDGLVVRTKSGDEFHLTAISVRDELFNRLIAMGSQMWELW